MKFTIDKLHDGGLVLGCGGIGMEETLVFASGAMVDDDHPLMAKQRAILEYIVKATEVYETICEQLTAGNGVTIIRNNKA
jgi:hypothetical protein